MKAQLHQAWLARSPRQRVAIAVLAAILAVVLYGWLLQSGSTARSQLKASVTTLRAEAAGLEQHALELGRLRGAPVTPASRSDLGAQLRAQADAAGLGHAVKALEAQDADQATVAFGAVAFSEWLDWVARLGAQQVWLSACRIEALPEPGMVSVTATLQRTR